MSSTVKTDLNSSSSILALSAGPEKSFPCRPSGGTPMLSCRRDLMKRQKGLLSPSSGPPMTLLFTYSPANKITSLQRPWKVLLSSCKRCVKTSRGRQCVEFSLRPQNDLKKRRAGTLTGRSGDVGLLWWRPGNVARKFCFHKNFPGTLSESFVSNRIVCLCSVNVV